MKKRIIEWVKTHWKAVALGLAIGIIVTFCFMNFEILALNWAGFANNQPVAAIQSNIHSNVYSVDWQIIPDIEPVFSE